MSKTDWLRYMPLVDAYFYAIAESCSSALLLEHLLGEIGTTTLSGGSRRLVLLDRLCLVVLDYEDSQGQLISLKFLFVRDREDLNLLEGCSVELRLNAELPHWHLAMVAVCGSLLEWLEYPKNIRVISYEDLAQMVIGTSKVVSMPIFDRDLVFDRLQGLYRYPRSIKNQFDLFRRAEMFSSKA